MILKNSKDDSISSESEQPDSSVGSQSLSPIKDREKDAGYVRLEGVDKTLTLSKRLTMEEIQYQDPGLKP